MITYYLDKVRNWLWQQIMVVCPVCEGSDYYPSYPYMGKCPLCRYDLVVPRWRAWWWRNRDRIMWYLDPPIERVDPSVWNKE